MIFEGLILYIKKQKERLEAFLLFLLSVFPKV
jgi:hypothetical protein